MVRHGKKPNRKLDSNTFLPGDIDDAASLRRTASWRNANLAYNRPLLRDDDARSDDKDSQRSDTDDANESNVDSISVATDTSSGTESADAVLQGKQASSPSYRGEL